MTIAVLGTGYVGLVAAVCFADAGHSIVCTDSDTLKITTLQNGRVPFYEPGLDDLFQLNHKRMQFVASVGEAARECEVVFVAVGTSERPDGRADMEPTFNVLKEICEAATAPKTIVLKSTVPVGTYRRVKAFVREHTKVPHRIVNNPEFLRQGAAVHDFLNPDRVVIGCEDEASRKLMAELYAPFVEKNNARLLFMDNTSAEMTKYAANSFLALKISFINELALLADTVGADIEAVRDGFTSDARISPAFFAPGIGYGGSCFPKDVRALIASGKDHDLDLLLLKAADAVNERQKTILVDRLMKRFGSLKGLTIALWGLSFKPRTDDVRRAPSLKIIEDLFLNGAQVRAYDPVAMPNAKAAARAPFETCESALQAVQGADALLVLTEWPEFSAVSLPELAQAMKQKILFDGRNLFDPSKMAEHGFEYFGIGRQMLSEAAESL